MISRIVNTNDLSESMQIVRYLGAALYKRGYIIAGGSIFCAYHKLPINDIDILSTHKDHACNIDIFMECLREAGLVSVKSLIPKESLYATNYDIDINGKVYKVQFIKAEGKATGTPNDIIGNFDIKNVSLYINERGNIASLPFYPVRRGMMSTTEEYSAIRLLDKKQLELGVVSSTSGTLQRIMKYASRGLEVNWNSILKQLHVIYDAKSKMKYLKHIIDSSKPLPPQRSIDVFNFRGIKRENGMALPVGFRGIMHHERNTAEDMDYENFVGLTETGFSPNGAEGLVASVNSIMYDLTTTAYPLHRCKSLYTQYGGEIDDNEDNS